MLNGLLDKCSYLDPRFRSTYLLNKDEVIFEIKQGAVSVAEKDVPSPSSEMIDEGNNEEPPKKEIKGTSCNFETHIVTTNN